MPLADLGSVRLYYELSGSGSPLVLIPGWTLNTHLWDSVAPALRRRHKVIVYDVRGAGRSASDPALEYSRVADAEDLQGLLERLGLPNAHLVGHSKGARIAFAFAVSRPQSVLSLTAIGSAEPQPPPGGPATFRAVTDGWVARCRHTARTLGVPAALQQIASARLFGKLRTSPEGMVRLRLAMEGYAGADLMSDTPKRAFDARRGISYLTMPIQILVGEQDPFLSECTLAADLIPQARLQILKRCGHMAPLERPQVVADAILEFASWAEDHRDEAPPGGFGRNCLK